MPKKIMSPEGYSWCGACKQHLPVAQFGLRRSDVPGIYNGRCKDCEIIRRQSKPGWKPKLTSKDYPAGQSWCSRCKSFKPVDAFTTSNQNKNGCSSWCLLCRKAYYDSLPEEKQAHYKAMSVKWNQENRRSPVDHVYKFPEGEIPAEKLTYIAGLFDAEGSFSIKAGAPCATLYNNNEALLRWVLQYTGGRLAPVVRKDRNGWTEWHLEFSNQPILKKLCQVLEPFLVLKKRRARILLEAMEIERRERDLLIAELRALNTKGQRIEPPQKTKALQTEIAKATTLEWAYFAAWLDGDRTIVLHRQNLGYTYPVIVIYSTKPEPLLHIQKTFGGMIDWRDRKIEGHAIECSLSFEDQNYVSRLIYGLYKYVVGKKAQLDVILDSLNYDPLDRYEHYEKVSKLNQMYSNPNPSRPPGEAQALKSKQE